MNTPALSELNTLLSEYTPKVLESTFFAASKLGAIHQNSR